MSSGIVIVGGGLAAAKTAQTYRESGGAEPVTIVSADSSPPYNRPPLSKGLLRGQTAPEATFVHPLEWYADNAVELRLETPAERVDAGARELVLAHGERLSFERLVVATGAVPRNLPAPGADLPGVHVYRTLSDATAVHAEAENASAALVVGASFIGMEVAASLRMLGLDVTVVEMGSRAMPALASDELSAGLVEIYRERGVEILLGESVEAFTGDGRLSGARLRSDRTVEADLAVIGIGVVPVTDVLVGTVAEIDNGIVVDERFRTGLPGVYAVGDVARFPDLVAGTTRRIEHWSNANAQGQALGRILAGSDAPFEHVSVFFTMLFDTKFQVFGDPRPGDEAAVSGDVREGRVAALYARDGHVSGATVSGLDDAAVAEAKRLVADRAEVSRLAGLAREVERAAAAA